MSIPLRFVPTRGEVLEWTNRHDWKSCVPLSVPRVRIPSSPPSHRHGANMSMNWKNDPNLSAMSDNDHLTQVAHSLTDAIHDNPEDARAWFLRGNAYLDRGANDFAASDYSRVIELTPDDAVAYNNRGIAFRNSGLTDLAIADYTKALELDADYRDAHNNLGMALSDKEEYEQAIVHFTRAIELDPDYWYAYNNRGMALWATGRSDDGIRDYERAKQLATVGR